MTVQSSTDHRAAPTSATDPEAADLEVDPEVVESLRSLSDEETPDFFRNLVEEFRHHAELRLAELRHAAAAGDAELIYRSAHSLRGSAGNLGARSLSSTLAELQDLGRSGRLLGAGELLERAVGSYQRAIDILARYGS